jgi:SOS-response transcriptional repressor LexA
MKLNELQQRVSDRLDVLGLGAVEAAQRVPDLLERNYIRDLILDKKKSISQAKAPAVAQALEWTVADLLATDRPTGPKQKREPATLRVPLLDMVTAGKLKAPSSQIPVEDVMWMSFSDLGRGDFFALKLEDDADSMDRISPPNSVIVVDKADRTLRNGRCYVFSIDGETTYKMWQEGDPAYLAPFSTNPNHKPIFVKKRRGFDVIGRVKRTVLDL